MISDWENNYAFTQPVCIDSNLFDSDDELSVMSLRDDNSRRTSHSTPKRRIESLKYLRTKSERSDAAEVTYRGKDTSAILADARISLSPVREIGTDVSKYDRENLTFNDKNVFELNEMVIIPRTKERLNYGLIHALHENGTATILLCRGNCENPPLTKILPTVLIGKLGSTTANHHLSFRARNVILTIESLFKFMKHHPPTSNNMDNLSLSPALYEHALYLLRLHSRCLYYYCKVFEMRAKGSIKEKTQDHKNKLSSVKLKEETIVADRRYCVPGDSRKRESVAGPIVPIVYSNNLSRNVKSESHDTPSHVVLERQNGTSDDEMRMSELEQQFMDTLRDKNRIIRSLKRAIRHKTTLYMQKLEEVQDKVESAFSSIMNDAQAD